MRSRKHRGARAPLAEVDPEIAALIDAEERYEADTHAPHRQRELRLARGARGDGLGPHEQVLRGLRAQALLRGPAARSTRSRSSPRAASQTLFGAEHVNVQPYSGSPANLAVYLAFVKPGETIMGLGLPAGGHLTHGWNVCITGKFFKSVAYGVRESDHRIDMDQVRELAKEHQPKLLWCGTTAYPRTLDFAAFRSIADEVGAILAADIAHIAGPRRRRRAPVAGRHRRRGHHRRRTRPSAARAARRSSARPQHAAAIDQAVFPGLQGGPHNHTTAAIAVAAQRGARSPRSRTTRTPSSTNAKALGEALAARGFRLITGGTDNHLLLIDLTPKGIAGKPSAQALERAGHRRQLQLDPVRSAQAVRPLGPPPRHARGHVARHGHGRDGAARRVDGRGRAAPGRRGAARAHRRRGEGALRRVPGAGAPGVGPRAPSNGASSARGGLGLEIS